MVKIVGPGRVEAEPAAFPAPQDLRGVAVVFGDDEPAPRVHQFRNFRQQMARGGIPDGMGGVEPDSIQPELVQPIGGV